MYGLTTDEKLQRFGKQTETGCIEWQRRRCYGYGQISVQGKTRRVHRVAWELRYGPIPAGMNVLHHCDNPPCYNLEHLYVGTQADNVRDQIARGRFTPGRKSTQSNLTKLTERQVIEIRERLKAGQTGARLAQQFGVTKRAIRHIKTRSTWSWLS